MATTANREWHYFDIKDPQTAPPGADPKDFKTKCGQPLRGARATNTHDSAALVHVTCLRCAMRARTD